MVVSGCKVLRGCVVRRICNSRTEGVLVLSREVDFGRSRKQTRLTVGGENHAARRLFPSSSLHLHVRTTIVLEHRHTFSRHCESHTSGRRLGGLLTPFSGSISLLTVDQRPYHVRDRT
jgi:hypothetical protein